MLKYLPLALGLAILSVGAFFVPWREVLPYFSKLTPTSYLLIIILGVAFYVVRILRYHYMLGVLNAQGSLRQTVLAYLIAQPVSLLPAGEAYRIITLNEHVDVPKSKGVSIVFIQAFTENISLVVLALLSAVILNQQVLIVVALMALYFVIFFLLRSRRTAKRSHRVITKLPFVSIGQSKYHSFISKNQQLLSGKSFVVLFLSGFGSTLFAIALLFFVANDIGVHLDVTDATIAYTLPTVLQNVSFLPGGIGINEQGTVGVLLLLGSSLPAAVAITLIMRFVTLILGIILGLFAILFHRVHGKTH